MSSTIRVEESVQIAKSPAEVWDAIADYAFDLEWRKGLREMTPDPPGQPAPGTKVHEVLRSSGRDYTADTVVTQLDPGVSYRFAGTGTMGGLGGGRAVHADPAGPGAVFTYAVELRPKGGMRLLGPVLGPFVRSGLKKDLQTLKTLLEEDRYRRSGAGERIPTGGSERSAGG
jgi:carbon monoxide dehydrogenase subunit G